MEKVVKYGIPILVAIVLFIQLKINHSKASSSADGISMLISFILWSVFFIGLLVAGLVMWFVSHKSYLILSFAFSIASFLAVFFIVPQLIMKAKSNIQSSVIETDFESQHDKQRAEEQAKIDSLVKELEANPNNLEASETLGMFYASKVDYKMALPYLEAAISKNSTNYYVYNKLADIYWAQQDFDKLESFDMKVLQLEAEGKLVFEKYQHEKFALQLEEVRKAKNK